MTSGGGGNRWLLYLTPRWHFEVSKTVGIVLIVLVVASAGLTLVGLAVSVPYARYSVGALIPGIISGLALLAIGLKRTQEPG